MQAVRRRVWRCWPGNRSKAHGAGGSSSRQAARRSVACLLHFRVVARVGDARQRLLHHFAGVGTAQKVALDDLRARVRARACACVVVAVVACVFVCVCVA